MAATEMGRHRLKTDEVSATRSHQGTGRPLESAARGFAPRRTVSRHRSTAGSNTASVRPVAAGGIGEENETEVKIISEFAPSDSSWNSDVPCRRHGQAQYRNLAAPQDNEVKDLP